MGAGGAAREPSPSSAPEGTGPGPVRQTTLDQFEGEAPRPFLPPEPVAEPLPVTPEGTEIVEEGGYVRHPLLRPERIRAFPFQLVIARRALEEDVMVVLPTGLGKTVIAALVAAERLRTRRGKVLFLAPTRPLVEQHYRSFGQWFRRLSRAKFTGTVTSPRREGGWSSAEAIFATPQLVVNDLREGRYSLRDVGLLILDEAHRAVGNYAYTEVAAVYRTQRSERGCLLALTASPGGSGARIEEVLNTLSIRRVEARSPDDPDVVSYVKGIDTEHVRVPLAPELIPVQKALKGVGHEAMVRLQRMGFLRQKPLAVTGVKDLLAARGAILARPGPMGRKFGALYQLMLAIHAHHALELVETQGPQPFLDYLGRLAGKPKPGRADRTFLSDPRVVTAREAARALVLKGGEGSQPKLDELVRVVGETLSSNPRAKVLVFAQYRDTVRLLEEALRKAGHAAHRFVGQASRSTRDRGMNQREQGQLVEAFREGRFPVLVASSVAEEGLDIPDVDLVVFYEALPSEIRTIQRRGRTGRSGAGRVVVLMSRATRDEGYFHAERKREAAMRRHIRRYSLEGRVRGQEEKPVEPPSRRTSRRRPTPGDPPDQGQAPEGSTSSSAARSSSSSGLP
jgi:ERCC4-related helicase